MGQNSGFYQVEAEWMSIIRSRITDLRLSTKIVPRKLIDVVFGVQGHFVKQSSQSTGHAERCG
jgi:hypothetical protein